MHNAAREKTVTRHALENSLRSTFSFDVTAASTHFMLGKKLSDKILNFLPKGTQETMKLVPKLNNDVPFKPTNPNLIFPPMTL